MSFDTSIYFSELHHFTFIEFYVGGSKELSVLFYAMQEHLEASVLYGPPRGPYRTLGTKCST